MATNHWVKDRVLDWLAKDATIGAKALQKRLEEQYHLQLSYWVVWDGRKMALDQLKGKWDDSFEHVCSFKAEVEKTNPGSLVVIEYEHVGKKIRYTRMIVALIFRSEHAPVDIGKLLVYHVHMPYALSPQFGVII